MGTNSLAGSFDFDQSGKTFSRVWMLPLTTKILRSATGAKVHPWVKCFTHQRNGIHDELENERKDRVKQKRENASQACEEATVDGGSLATSRRRGNEKNENFLVIGFQSRVQWNQMCLREYRKMRRTEPLMTTFSCCSFARVIRRRRNSLRKNFSAHIKTTFNCARKSRKIKERITSP